MATARWIAPHNYETKLWLSPFAKQCQNPCSRYPPVYQDLSTFHDWPVKKDLINLPIREKENQNALLIIDSFRAQNKDLSVSLQTSLAKAEVHLQIMQSSAKRMLETTLGLTLLVPRVTNINFRPAISIHHQEKRFKGRLWAAPLQSVESKFGRTGASKMAKLPLSFLFFSFARFAWFPCSRDHPEGLLAVLFKRELIKLIAKKQMLDLLSNSLHIL